MYQSPTSAGITTGVRVGAMQENTHRGEIDVMHDYTYSMARTIRTAVMTGVVVQEENTLPRHSRRRCFTEQSPPRATGKSHTTVFATHVSLAYELCFLAPPGRPPTFFFPTGFLVVGPPAGAKKETIVCARKQYGNTGSEKRAQARNPTMAFESSSTLQVSRTALTGHYY